MSTKTDLSDWPTEGAEVRSWGGRYTRPGPVRTVVRLTATQIVLDDDSRWNRHDLTVRGRGYGRLVPPDAPGLAEADAEYAARDAEAAAESARKNAAWRIQDLGPRWANNPTDENLAKLRAAVVALAPHLGLTVTDAVAPTETEENQP